jgi:hypothetical protein
MRAIQQAKIGRKHPQARTEIPQFFHTTKSALKWCKKAELETNYDYIPAKK